MASEIISISVQEPNAAEALAAIRRYDAAGVPAAWLTTGGIGADALTLFGAVAAQTERILMGTSIVPTYPRHPLVVVQQAQVIASLAPGRLRVGVGPSHKPAVEGMYGFSFDAPLGHLREYLTILKQALTDGAIDFDGKHYHAHGRVGATPSQPVPVMASALRPRAFRLCGEIADGAITWLCPLPYVRDVAMPALRQGARTAGRDVPSMVAHVPFALSTDAEAVRAAARQQLAGYPRLPYYSQMLIDAGLQGAASGTWDDQMIDLVVAHGDENRVAARLREFFAAGASEIIAAPLVIGDRRASSDRAAEFLAGLARTPAAR